MGYIGIIVESPAKCKKIESYLGSKYKCVASFGHFRTLNNLDCIDLSNFNLKFVNLPGKSKQINLLKNFIKNADQILLATDDDREGEAIAWHICDLFKLPITTKRIIFNEITKPALIHAVDNPISLDINKVNAQKARQVLDLIIGFKISPLLWEYISFKTKSKLSAGRCQTPALRLIYDNQTDIDNNPGKKIYQTIGYFTNKNIGFTLNKEYSNEEDIINFLEESIDFTHIYTCSDKEKTYKKPPNPFTTSSLQQKCSADLKISPKLCMSICQKLYEGGYITYMRTDSITYSDEFLEKSKKYIKKKYGEDYISKDISNLSNKNNTKSNSKAGSNNNAQEAHEAIRPTDLKKETIEDDNFNSKEKRVYKLIKDNTVASCMTEAIYNKIVAEVSAPPDLKYKYQAEQAVFLGWQIIFDKVFDDEYFNYLLNLKQNTPVKYSRIFSKLVLKNLNKHYTEANLVQKLEKCGIGRPSTFASLVDKIQERDYVKIDNIKGKKIECVDYELVGEELSEITDQREFGGENKKLIIQQVGSLVIDFLIKNYDQLFNYDYTKNMEDKLDDIAKGKLNWKQLCKDCLNQLADLDIKIDNSKKITKKTIKIDKDHTYIVGKYGPVIKYEKEGKVIFKKIKEDIDLEKLERGEYTLEDILLLDGNKERIIGKKENKNVVLKNGKYGYYLEWNSIKKSVNIENKNFDEIEMSDVESYLCKSSFIEISKEASLREGKFGPYIYYKTNTMKKPRFITFNETISAETDKDYLKKWLLDKHKINIK